MRNLIDLLNNLLCDVIDIARYFYVHTIDTLGNLGHIIVNTLIGITIVLLVGLDFVFVDYWEEFSKYERFGEAIFVLLVVHLVLIVKIVAMLQAVQSRPWKRRKDQGGM